MSKIFLTGAFGNIGRHTLEELLQQGHEVTCFDLPTSANQRLAKYYQKFEPYQKQVKTVFGDVRYYTDTVDYLYQNDAAIHLAAIIPPLSERNPELSKDVNLFGTRNIVEAMTRHPKQGPLIFASSVAVYGKKQFQEKQNGQTVCFLDDPVEPSDNYTEHKIKSEEQIKAKLPNWTILRLGVVPPQIEFRVDPVLYEIPLSTKIHFLHPKDAATAFANCIGDNVTENAAVKQKTLLVAGDESCRVTYGTYLNNIFQTMGVSLPPGHCFTQEPYYSYWMDTTESQQLLQYQNHSFDDFLKEVTEKLGWRRQIIKYLHPFIERWMERKSPYGKKI